MRICIPIEFKKQGGGFYFLDNFSRFLRENGHEVTGDIDAKYEVLFTNSWMTPYRDVLRAIWRNPQVRIIHRIDGSAQNYGRDPQADYEQSRINRLADLTVFQSQYARYSTREKFPVIDQDGPVIYNPVDLAIFKPSGTERKFPRNQHVACVTWSTNRMKGASKIYAVAAEHPRVDFVLCGNFPDAPELPNIQKSGVLDREQLAEVLRSCKAMLTFSQNEACPNHVLEALACGLPVLYGDSGAMREVIGDCGLPVTVEDFGSQFTSLLQTLPELSRAARNRAEQVFNPSRNFAQYVEHIQTALARPIRIPWRKRWLSAAGGMLAGRVGLK
ncbi:MAG: glycosyltransferase family 4 protein [Anaerolineales bacterium]|nr:glycosyltransferase family 4 protein [Anaerolineales bacterium]